MAKLRQARKGIENLFNKSDMYSCALSKRELASRLKEHPLLRKDYSWIVEELELEIRQGVVSYVCHFLKDSKDKVIEYLRR